MSVSTTRHVRRAVSSSISIELRDGGARSGTPVRLRSASATFVAAAMDRPHGADCGLPPATARATAGGRPNVCTVVGAGPLSEEVTTSCTPAH